MCCRLVKLQQSEILRRCLYSLSGDDQLLRIHQGTLILGPMAIISPLARQVFICSCDSIMHCRGSSLENSYNYLKSGKGPPPRLSHDFWVHVLIGPTTQSSPWTWPRMGVGLGAFTGWVRWWLVRGTGNACSLQNLCSARRLPSSTQGQEEEQQQQWWQGSEQKAFERAGLTWEPS